MKKLFYAAASFCLLAGAFGCSDDYDDSALWNKVNGIDGDIENIKTDLEALKRDVEGLNQTYRGLTQLLNGGLITSVVPVQEGERTGYKFTVKMSDTDPGTEYTIWNGTNGKDGADGKDGEDGAVGATPVLGVAKDEASGRYYWTVKVGEAAAEPLTDADGNYIYTDGLTPQLKVTEADEEGKLLWYVGYDKNADGTIDDDEWGEPFGPFSGSVVGNSNIDASVADGVMTIMIGEESYSFPIAAVLGITFGNDVSDGVHMQASGTYVLSYTLTGASEHAVVKAEFQNPGTFTLETSASAITITAGEEYGKTAVVIVSVYDGPSCYHTSFTVAADLTALKKIELTADSFSSEYTCASEGSLAGLCDGTDAHWHSEYNLSTTNYLTTSDYGIYIDIDLGAEYSEFACKYQVRATNANAAPTGLLLGVSADGTNWTQVGSVTSGLPKDMAAWWDGLGTRFSNGGTKFRHVRFGITSSALAGDLTNKTLNTTGDCTALSELEVYAQ